MEMAIQVGKQAGKGKATGISAITVKGFKSVRDEQRLEIRPLTILAGANGTGKSSVMQPLLLLKQTLDSPHDPGPLRLDGPNVSFSTFDQLRWRDTAGRKAGGLTIGLENPAGGHMKETFNKEARNGLVIESLWFGPVGRAKCLRPNMTLDELRAVLPSELWKVFGEPAMQQARWRIVTKRCFLDLDFQLSSGVRVSLFQPGDRFESDIRGLIHLPALRDYPERVSPTIPFGWAFGGPFQTYLAGVLRDWKGRHDERLDRVSHDFEDLGLTWKVDVQPVDDTHVEMRVGRLTKGRRGGARDLVNIADAGFGVSQVLPIVVALRAASKGRIVYVEQPEIHLHPRAQVAMASLLADAAKRGVRLVVETHSALLLLAVQTLVAKGQLDPALVKLHWFERDKDGATHVHSGELDEQGRFGDWPEDFGHVELRAEQEYLDASLG
jgi:hypothetical protein